MQDGVLSCIIAECTGEESPRADDAGGISVGGVSENAMMHIGGGEGVWARGGREAAAIDDDTSSLGV